MLIEDFIITVYCLVDDALKNLLGNRKIRQRSFKPSLSDSEMITMEVIAEFLGVDTDKGAWEYLTNRIARKVLAHTVCVFINKQLCNPSLQFEILVQP